MLPRALPMTSPAFIEIDSYDIWGEDFRSNYVTGVDARAASGDDVEMYQAYIEAEEMSGAYRFACVSAARN